MKKFLTLTLLSLLVGVSANAARLYVQAEGFVPRFHVWGGNITTNWEDGGAAADGRQELAGVNWYYFEMGTSTGAIVRYDHETEKWQTGNIENITADTYITVNYSDATWEKRNKWQYPLFLNNIDNLWDTSADHNGTVEDPFTFSYTLGKSKIGNADKIWFRFRPYESETYKPQVYPNAEGLTIGHGASTSSYYENTNYTEWSFGVEIPSFDYDAVKLTARYNYVDGDWKWIISADVNALVTISSYGVSTFACEDALDFTGVSGITPYKGAVENNVATFTAINAPVPANTGIMVKGTAGQTYAIPAVATGTAVEGNELVGATVETDITGTDSGYKNLVLKAPNDELGFYLPTGSFTVGAHTAYLHTAAANVEETTNAKVSLNFGDETGINTISRSNNDNVYYDLQGRRVANPTKGLFIVNGKKVIK